MNQKTKKVIKYFFQQKASEIFEVLKKLGEYILVFIISIFIGFVLVFGIGFPTWYIGHYFKISKFFLSWNIEKILQCGSAVVVVLIALLFIIALTYIFIDWLKSNIELAKYRVEQEEKRK